VWLAKACDKDEPIACRVYGAMLFDGVGVKQDRERGITMMKRACDRKDTDACSLVARMNPGSGVGSGSSTGATSGDAGVK
jgi:TPR repeat protein